MVYKISLFDCKSSILLFFDIIVVPIFRIIVAILHYHCIMIYKLLNLLKLGTRRNLSGNKTCFTIEKMLKRTYSNVDISYFIQLAVEMRSHGSLWNLKHSFQGWPQLFCTERANAKTKTNFKRLVYLQTWKNKDIHKEFNCWY